MAYNSLQQLRTNIEAIRIALFFQPGDRLEEGQLDTLHAYAGFGGLKAILFPSGPLEEWRKLNASQNDLKLYPSLMELHVLLQEKLSEADYKTAVDSLRDSVLTAYYTPAVVPQVLYQVLKDHTIAARYYLNAIDKAESQAEKISAQLKEFEYRLPSWKTCSAKNSSGKASCRD
jgi:hypothetical protein